VGVRFTSQQLSRTFAHPFGMFAAEKSAVVEKKLQQGEIIGA
jgi:hypothetical protein